MHNDELYDVVIVGGGLAGLALSIQCARRGYKTTLFEKEKYPFHRVCGEYVSFESWNFLEELGIPLSQMNLPVIRTLLVTAPNGRQLEHDLPLGGFGISRYMLDGALAEIATKSGVEIRQETKVADVRFDHDFFNIECPGFAVKSKIVAGTFGKRSNLDIKWKRKFALQKPNKLNNYIAVKYHVRTKWSEGLIALHNFENGYCGISQIEDSKYCLCYLTTAANLEKSGNSVPQMEKEILSRNPFLRQILEDAETMYDTPVIISQVSFEKKPKLHDHVLLVGDAAGMITPLCGNGMSMALHGSKIAFEQIDHFLQLKTTRREMEVQYAAKWRKEFGRRLRAGRMIQRFFGSALLSNLLITSLKPFPSLTRWLISQTHGQPF